MDPSKDEQQPNSVQTPPSPSDAFDEAPASPSTVIPAMSNTSNGLSSAGTSYQSMPDTSDPSSSNDHSGHSRTADKPSHDSGMAETSHDPSGPSGATTPASRTSMDASSDLFHATTLKVHDKDAGALDRIWQAFPANHNDTSPGTGSTEVNGGKPMDAVPAPLTTPIPSSPSTVPTFKSRMPANLALRAANGNGNRDIPSPSQSSPLRQSMTFQQEQLSQLKLDDGRKEEVELLISPSESNAAIPRSISLPVTAIKDSPLPLAPDRYADAEEIAFPTIEMSAFPAGSSRDSVNRLVRDNSTSSHLADMASVCTILALTRF
jgi:hypothetical protein